MKKILLGIFVGLILGRVITYWLMVPHESTPASATPAKDAAAPADAAKDAPEPGTVHLETDEQEKAGLQTAHPSPMEYKPEAKGFARVLDPAPLEALVTELAADQAALDASSKEFARIQSLKASDNASSRALEMAQADMKHDQAQVDSVKARLLSDWGKTLVQRDDLQQLANDLLAHDAALIRVDMLGGETLPSEPRELRVTPLFGNVEPVPAELLGPAPNADPQEQGTAFLALIRKNPPPPGASMVALMAASGAGQKGLKLPAAAIVRYEGDIFVYVQTNGEDFERWRVKLGPPLRDGVFLTEGVTAQDNVVVTGAGQLLSEELKAASRAAGLNKRAAVKYIAQSNPTLMLKALIQLSLRFRGVVVTLACVVMGYGLYVATHAKLDVLPDFVPPEVTVQTESPGLSAEQVETLVTRPLENQLNGLGNEESMRSESIQGLSVITIVFTEGTPILPARQMLAEKLGSIAGSLPAGVKAPTMSPLTSATMDLLKIGLLSDKLTPMELRTFADWTLKPRLLAVPGVADCKVFGGEVRQWQIEVHPDLLAAHNLGLDDVLAAAKLTTGVLGAGFIENENQRLVIQTEGQSVTAAELENVVVAVSSNGVPVRIKEIATVREGAEPKFGDALIMGKPGVLMTMSNQYGSNTMDVTIGLEKALADMDPIFKNSGITLYGKLHRPATFIEVSIANIKDSLKLGAILVAVVLFLFLGHIRTALISLTAIPLSLLTAVLLMDRFGVDLNTITLGGLAIAIGVVVDDAIIGVENILRRLRENHHLPKPRPTMDVVLDATLEVRSAVVYATFVVALVFVPVLTLTGLSGSFFAPLALSYILAIMASLMVALTVTPALTYLLFGKHKHDKMAEAPKLQVILRNAYTRLLGVVARHPRIIVAAVLLLCLAALLPLPFLGGELLPDFREGHLVIGVKAAPGTSLPESLRIGKEISAALLKNDRVATVEEQIGRAERGEDTWGPNQSEFHVELKHPPEFPPMPAAVEAKVADEIRDALDKIPGIQYEVVTFLGDRINETIGGETAPIAINIYGDDLDELDLKANEIMSVLNSLGAQDVQVSAPPGSPLIDVKLRGERLTELGFRPVEVLEAIESAFSGTTVAQVYEGSQVTDVAVILDEQSRSDPSNVGSLILRSPTGLLVPLSELADVENSSGRFSILHDGARRRQTVTCAPGARDVTSFVALARDAIAKKVTLPKGLYIEFTGEAEAKAHATTELLIHIAIASLGILMLLYVVLGNWRNLFLVLANLPFALVGGALAVYYTNALSPPDDPHGLMHILYIIVSKIQSFLGGGGGGVLTMGSLVGFVTLFGITARNTIMLLSHYEHLVTEEGQPWNEATVVRGASERLVPILMTALVTALGLLPLAIGSGEAGREIEGPMAIVILGGLITSTALNLLVMPTLAGYWFRPRVNLTQTNPPG